MFVDYNIFSYVLPTLEHVEAYAKVTSEGVRYLEIIEELKSALPNNLEKAETFPSDLQYHQPQYEIIWEDCRERNILSTKKGQAAYRQVCLGRYEEARKLLKEAADKYYTH